MPNWAIGVIFVLAIVLLVAWNYHRANQYDQAMQDYYDEKG